MDITLHRCYGCFTPHNIIVKCIEGEGYLILINARIVNMAF